MGATGRGQLGGSTIGRELTDVDPVPTYPRWPLALSSLPRAEVPDIGFEQKLTQGALRREAKQLLFAEGDAVTYLYRIDGATALNKVLADRRRQVMGFAYPGDLVGLGIEGEHVINAQAIKPTGVRCFPIASLRQSIADDPTHVVAEAPPLKVVSPGVREMPIMRNSGVANLAMLHP